MKGKNSKPGAGSAPKSNHPYTVKPSSPIGKGTFTGAGKHPYAKKGAK